MANFLIGLMEHRWKKGKGESKLPNGEKIIFLTVGGRTSAVVPSVQKKTGNMSNAAEEAETEAGIGGEGEDEKPKSIGKKFFEKFTSKLSQGLAKAPPAKRPREVKEESDDDDEDDDLEVEEKKPVKKTKRMSKPSAPVKVEDATGDGRRRSTRSSKR